MLTTGLVGEDPEFVEVRVCEKIRIATERAAQAGSKPVSDFLEDILIDHLSKLGYLPDPIDLKLCLSSNNQN